MGFKDWGFLPYVAERLARAGLAVVSFTFSGAGVGEQSDTFDEPERFGHNTYTNELRDLDIVLDALTQGAFGFQPSAYGLFGYSAGGGIAVLRAAQDERVRALVTWAADARFGRLIAPLTDELRRTGTARVVSQHDGRELPLYRDMLDDLDAHGAGPLDVVRAAGGVGAAGVPGQAGSWGRAGPGPAGRGAGRGRRARAVAHRTRHGGSNGAVGRRTRSPQRGARRRAGAVSGRWRRPRLRRGPPLGRGQYRAGAGGAPDGGLVRAAPRLKSPLAAVRYALP